MPIAKNSIGFSLLELLITIAIIVMLATLSMSGYQRYVVKASVVQGQADLLALAAKMEAFRLKKSTYIGAAGSPDKPTATGKPWLYSSYSPSSTAPKNKKFDLYITTADDYSYELLAQPLNDKAQRLLYVSSGSKYWDKNNDGKFQDSEACWRC